MNQEYDTIVLGTGLKECILSGLLSANGKTVLHMDRNNYYGGESASLSLEQLYQKFKPDQKIPEDLGRSRDYNVDLCPKFIMACGDLVKVLLHTKVTRYLEFRSVAGSFVYKESKIHKVPSTAGEAMATSLMGMFQKRYFRNYLNWVNAYDVNDQKTWDGLDARAATNAQVFKKFGLDDNGINFIGHAMALYSDDAYLEKPSLECLERVKLYAYSVTRYGNSPYIYPVYGLGGLPEGFSRLCAIHGGVYMLNKPIEEILYHEDGKVKGVRSQGEVAYCRKLLADPSYFLDTNKIRKTGQVARCICILNHPIDNTDNADSCQIIIPAAQLENRKSDIYVSVVSFHHSVAAKNKWIAVIQLNVETANAKTEFTPALALLGKRDVDFFWVSDTYEPTGDGSADNIFITETYDASSHFESATVEVIKLFEKIAEKKLDLSIAPDLEEVQSQ